MYLLIPRKDSVIDKTFSTHKKINELEYTKNHEVLDDGFEDKLIVTLQVM